VAMCLLGLYLQALKQQLSPVQQYVQAQLAKLRTGSDAEKAEALKGLGRQGSSRGQCREGHTGGVRPSVECVWTRWLSLSNVCCVCRRGWHL
jgi:hypothetical protein